MYKEARRSPGHEGKSQLEAAYFRLLKDELLLALGCTEPIAIAYASARCRRLLGQEPENITIACSGNIIKNVKSVIIPTTGNMRGIETAAILGAVAGDDSLGMEVLSKVTAEDVERTARLKEAGLCKAEHLESASNLHIIVRQQAGEYCAMVEVANQHLNVIREEINGFVMVHEKRNPSQEQPEGWMTMRGILQFANDAPITELKEALWVQMENNLAIAKEGLRGRYGAQVGKTMLWQGDQSPRALAIAHAAAGSDARMGGCAMPVVVNSGSGNQGMTVSLPVVVYAQAIGMSEEKMFRALAFSNLLALYQKSLIGKLSAYCGVVSAGCASVAAIAYLEDADFSVIEGTIINMLGTIAGMVCDGAKASCAAKIVAALQTGFMAYDMAQAGHVFHSGDGLIKQDADHTIYAVGRMGKEGMRSTDTEILRIMMQP